MLGSKTIVFLAVAALVGAVHATSDEEELAKLPERLRIFEKFCLDSRDLIIAMGLKENEKLERNNIKYENTDDAIDAVCDFTRKQSVKARAGFEEYKKTSLGDQTETFAHLDLAAVPCATTTKVITGEKYCENLRQFSKDLRNWRKD